MTPIVAKYLGEKVEVKMTSGDVFTGKLLVHDYQGSPDPLVLQTQYGVILCNWQHVVTVRDNMR